MNKTTNLKSAYVSTTRENIGLLINYLQAVGGKVLTVSCKRQDAFKTKWEGREVNLRNRCHVQNATDYLKHIIKDYSVGQIRIVIADIAKYVNGLDANEDVSFILLSTNTLPSPIHFDIARNLFINHQTRDQYQNNYNTDLLTIYSMRLALESRIKGLLGIDYATSKGKNVGLSSLIKISKGLKWVKYSDDINWTEIEWINEWINHHMHRHIRPYPWIIYQALDSLESFVNSKIPFVIGSRTVYSFYSSTYVANEEELHNEIESVLELEFPEIQIVWLKKREILK